MVATELKRDGGQGKRRRAVKIVRPRRISRATWISVGLIVGAAFALPLFWNLSQEDAPLVAVQTREVEVEVTWRCEVGHTFRASAKPGSRPCLECNRSAYPLTRYSCPVHGGYRVEIEFGEPVEDELPMERVRLIGQEWRPIEEGLRCPVCDRTVVYDRARALDPVEKPGGT